jgi:hypothetical protein
MNLVPKIREWFISVWHATLDYDRKIPSAKKLETKLKRESDKERRLAKDARRVASAKVSAESRKQRNELAIIEKASRPVSFTIVPSDSPPVSEVVSKSRVNWGNQSDSPPLPSSETRCCPFCSEEIKATASKCKHCGEFLDGHNRNAPSSMTRNSGIPSCQQCGGKMKKTEISKGNCAGIVVALIVICVGIVIFFIIPVIGWVVGPAICIGALFMGGTKNKVWRCVNCGSIVNRA